MNENVPIATLSGISSLTDVLPELPFPSPSPSAMKDGLLYNPSIIDEARKVLSRPDPAVVQQLAQALSAPKSTNDQLIFKVSLQEDCQPIQGGPLLLQAVMAQTPQMFNPQPEQDNYEGLPSECYPQLSPRQQVPPSCLSLSQYPASSGVVNQVSPHRHAVHYSPRAMVSPLQLSADVQDLATVVSQATGYPPCTGSASDVHQSPSHHTGPGHGMISTPCVKGQRTDGDSAVQRKLNSNFLLELSANNVQGTEPLSSNSVDALGYLTSRNGIAVPSNSNEHQLQDVSTRKEQQPYWAPGAEGQLDCSQHTGNSNGVFKPGTGLRRKSSKSRSPDNAVFQDCDNINQEVNVACLNGNVVCSKQPSTDEVQGWDVASIISTKDNTDICQTTKTLTNPQGHGCGSFITLQPEVRLTPVEHFSPDAHSRIKPDQRNCSVRSEPETIVSSTPLRHEMQLCIPKLVITKIKQRRGSKEVETHKVRAVFSGEEGVSIPMGQKRKRESDEESEDQHFKKEEKEKKTKKAKVEEVEDIEALMDSITFKRFTAALEDLFQFDDECDVPDIQDTDEQEPALDTLIPRLKVMEFYSETAKLKSLDVLHQVPTGQLIRLLTIMERHIRDGFGLQMSSVQDDDEEQKLWREICLDRMMRSVEASLVVLNVLTSSSMPKQLYLEEVMDRIIRLAKLQLHNTIFPEYDPVYRDPDAKEGTIPTPKSKRSRTCQLKLKPMAIFCNKMCALVSSLGDLVDIQTLTDTAVLQVSSLGTSPFFVENVSELQHSALKLVRSVFRKYVKHRDLILEDIFASLARLPSSKRNLRGYRLGKEESIQMVTALVLQLIQCSVKIPNNTGTSDTAESMENEEDSKPVDRDVLLISSYENALRTAQNFLSMFLSKCISVGKDEEDYRPLFENFLQDLLVMLNKPEWPAAEVLLTLLGRLLIVTFNSKNNDVSLRVSAIEYLGVVAAHLRKDAVTSQKDSDAITEVIVEQLDELSDGSSDEMSHLDERSNKRQQVLQKALAEYLNTEGHKEPALLFARQFFLGQWIRDTHIELERAQSIPSEMPVDVGESFGISHSVDAGSIEKLEEKKKFFLGIMDSTRNFSELRSHSALDNERAPLVSRYLASSRSFSKSFDVYLNQCQVQNVFVQELDKYHGHLNLTPKVKKPDKILRVLTENAVAIRTKAMKALSQVVSADPSILSRDDMQKGVHARFVDMSTSVREAAVELIGRFVLNKPDLIHQYYDMIIERILDTGISVRKRVIKILRDICLTLPDFPKVTEICVKIIRRISDEEGIKDLVTKVFQQMWFTPDASGNQEALLQRVVHMTDVVSACGDNGDWFEHLMENLLNNEEESVVRTSEQACEQVVKCLVENILRQEEKVVAQSEGKISSSQRLLASLSTLYLISKVKPKHLVNHATTLQPYLSTKCNTQGDYLVIHNVARILELVVPLMEHPSESFLANLEESLMKLTVKHGQTVVQSCIGCLGAVVNKVTHNIRLVKDYFQKYYVFKATITASQTTFGRVKRCIDISSSVPHTLRKNAKESMSSCHRLSFESSSYTGKENVWELSKVSPVIHQESATRNEMILLSQPGKENSSIGTSLWDYNVYWMQIDEPGSKSKHCVAYRRGYKSRVFLAKAKADISTDSKKLQASRPTLLRSLFTLGLICKHFDFDSDVKPHNQESSIKDKVFAVYIFFTQHKDEEICQKAITGLGFLCMRYTDLLLKGEAKNIYHNILSSGSQSTLLKIQVLKNLQTHLLEEEKRLRLQDHHWHKQPEKENLKDLGDSLSGTTSAVMQLYLKNVLDNFLHWQFSIRMGALQVVDLILRQGLVHPVQCVPYLIAIGTDEDPQVRAKSDHQLTEIDTKFSGFVQMKSLAGVKMSFELQKLVQTDKTSPIRGIRSETSQSLLSHMYTVIRTGRQPRRSLLQSMLRLFDDHKKVKLDLLLYVADNLAHFPYVIQEEPLFIIHHVDTMLSVAGANAMQSFQEVLLSEVYPDGQQTNAFPEDEDEESNENILARIPSDPSEFVKCCVASQSCILLLYLKEQLKELYTLSDSKCHKYAPSEPTKAYDKNVSRKAGLVFNPEQAIDYVVEPDRVRTRHELAGNYCNFKTLLMRLDPAEEDSDLSDGRESPAGEAPMGEVEGQSKTPGRRATKPKKIVKGRRPPPGKGKAKPKKKRKKVSVDIDLGDDDKDFNM